MTSLDAWTINDDDDTDGYVRVLSLDGGGTRGIIGAHILTEIENRTGKKISELFDLVCGTSTGGIISVCLTLPYHYDKDGKRVEGPYSAEELRQMYFEEATTIFPPPPFANGPKFLRDFCSFLITLFKAVFGGPKHSADGINKVAAKYIPNKLTLADTVIPILISSFCTSKSVPFPFFSNLASKSEDENFYLYDVARATSAAPTFLPPVEFGSVHSSKNGGSKAVFVDGAISANNPSFQAIIAAKRVLPDHKVFAVSIGAGTFTEKRPLYGDISKWGLLQWGPAALLMMMSASSYLQDRASDIITNNQAKRDLDKLDYFRFDVLLDEIDNQLDDPSAAHLKRMVDRTDEVYFNDKTSDCSKRFDHVVKRLLEIDNLPSRESTRRLLLNKGIVYPESLKVSIAIS